MSLAMRNEVPVELTWDLSLIYPTEEAMYRDVEKMKALCASMEERFKGKLTTPEAICDCLNDLQEMTRLMTLTGNYTDLAVSVDYYDSHNQERNDRVMNIISDINSRLSFINSEITEQSEETLKASIAIAGGSRIYLEDILRRKPHQLHPETERALSALSQTLNTPYQIYNMTKLADMKFDSFHANNKDYPLGYSLFEDDYEYESDTQIRRSAFDAFSKKLAQYENTTAAAYNSQVQTEKTMATLRGFESVFDSLLFDQKVSRELYDRQIDLITTKLSVHMRKYARLLKKIHKLDRMTFADLKISVDPEYDPKVTIEGSKEYIEKGLSILGPEYVDMVREAYRNRWVDFAKNQGKSTGGFCASPYGTNSFILLSWNDRMADVFTLAHEMGHSIHTWYSNKNQSYTYSGYKIFVAEVASTCNEALLIRHLLKNSKDKQEKAYLLNYFLESFRGTLFRQTMFAEFEQKAHEMAAAGESMTSQSLCNIYKKLNEDYFGPDTVIDPEIQYEWERIPHFYTPFYVYQYATGFSAAIAISRKIFNGEPGILEGYKKFLSGGCSDTPIELLKLAGVDLSHTGPVEEALKFFEELLNEFEELA